MKKALEIRPELSASTMALRFAVGYAVVGILWVLAFDALLSAVELPPPLEHEVSEGAGIVLVLLTAGTFFVMSRAGIAKVLHAQQSVHEQETRIRRAYVDVLDAVTGGRLVLVTIDELNEMLGESISEPTRIGAGRDLSAVRARIKELATGIVPAGWVSKVISASGEALNNALKHAGSAQYEVLVREGFLQVRVSDEGPGIDFRTLPKATLVPGFSTANTLGMGFSIMLQQADRMLICTQPGNTSVVLEFARSEAAWDSMRHSA